MHHIVEANAKAYSELSASTALFATHQPEYLAMTSAPRAQKLTENNLKLVGAVSNLNEGCFAAKHELNDMHKYPNLWSVLGHYDRQE